MHWMILPLKRYADFSGRSRRMEYWMFMLGVWLFYAVCITFALVFGDFSEARGSEPSTAALVFLVVMMIGVLGLIVPSLAVQVRRLHDQDKSGWMVLINLIPYVGGLIVFVFMCLPGTSGENRYGPDPLDPGSAARLNEVFN